MIDNVYTNLMVAVLTKIDDRSPATLEIENNSLTYTIFDLITEETKTITYPL
ncbi:hypothetical protein ACIQ4I_10240 [Rummeliibacillus sp. NPDC094406]|uniref:hypothetical protein n=1 Tax=Rummeliibacillus sp. NPDC094406 TaxID=3364511 RepID=UPI00381CA4CA